MNRTANKELRNILRTQKAYLEKKEQQLLYGFDTAKICCPTLPSMVTRLPSHPGHYKFSAQKTTRIFIRSGEEEHFSSFNQDCPVFFLK